MTRRTLLTLLGLVIVAAGIAAIAIYTPAGDALHRVFSGQLVSEAPEPMSMPTADGEARTQTPARGEVTIDPRRLQQIGVRLVSVRRTTIGQEVRAAGVVRFDETRQAEITTKVDGWIRDLRADFTGRTITRGETLFTLYSPALLAAQNEYLLAVRGHAQAASSELASVREYAERLHQAARERLQRWDLSDADIQEIERSGRATDTVTFRSPATGTIVEKVAVEGMHVTAGQTLFRVADLSVVWVDADVPAHEMAAVRVGRPATVAVDAFPGEPLAGRATYVYPTVDETTRTAKVRFQFTNRGGRLKPGMFATIQLTGPVTDGLTVPTDAVLEAGRDQLVFVALGEGRFEPRPVKIGRRTREDIEITEGVKEGEQVAAGAAFFLDSESQLRAAVQSYQAPSAQAAPVAAGPQLSITLRPQPDPLSVGENLLEVTVRDANGTPITDVDVTVTFFMPAMPTMNMPAMRNQAKLPSAGGGIYRGAAQVLTGGRWDVTVDVRRGSQRLGSRQFAVVAR
jgi:RND family efflux transporter MFP subunit